MASWSETTKHEPSSINGGRRYEKPDRVPREQLNLITENSFYAVNKSDEALRKANSAFENNGTIVRVANVPQSYVDFKSNPQDQLDNMEKGIDTSLKEDDIIKKILPTIANIIYPIGTIYVSEKNEPPQITMFEGISIHWEPIGGDQTFWITTQEGEGGKSVSAGLPNIEGFAKLTAMSYHGNGVWEATGAFTGSSSYRDSMHGGGGSSQEVLAYNLNFNAQNGNQIYGNSTTVQPPAIKVYAWRRTA